MSTSCMTQFALPSQFAHQSLDTILVDEDTSGNLSRVLQWFQRLAREGNMVFSDPNNERVVRTIHYLASTGNAALRDTSDTMAIVQKHGERLTHTTDQRELVFVHIPKTAGMSVWFHVARPRGVPDNVTHATARAWQQAMGESRWRKALSFSIIRDPCQRLRSAWYYLRSQRPGDRWWISDAKERSLIFGLGESLNEFVRNLPDTLPQDMENAPHFAAQSCFTDIDGTNAIDVRLPFHRLEDAWAKFCLLCGRQLRLPKNNPTRSLQYQRRDELTMESRRKIRRLYQRDFQILEEIGCVLEPQEVAAD